MRSFIIEIATTDFNTTRSAAEGGADRIELCSALTEGGITPSYGMIRICREKFDLDLFPIIRPRAGDFLYNEEEYQVMQHDIQYCRQLGCNGVVSGILSSNGDIDLERTSRLIELAYPMEFTFHRAFDRCRDPFTAMEQLIGAGCQRILTSGQRPTATEGIELITELVKTAGDRIIIMPGSGVRKENIGALVQTGAVEFHSSLRGAKRSEMEFIHPSFSTGDQVLNPGIDPEEVKALRKALLN